MQAYSASFAPVYNRLWVDFAWHVAPRICALYEQTAAGAERRPVLDVCCGTGQLALYLLAHGFDVTGLDLSRAMLAYALRNTAEHVAAGRARYVQADASRFAMARRFGLVVSTFDALNHLDDMAALRACFECVRAALIDGGLFVFDLNTRVGLGRWAGQRIIQEDDLLLVQRGVFDFEARKSWTTLLGFLRRPDGLYERFEDKIFNTMFDLAEVEKALRAAGFVQVHMALPQDLAAPLADPEAEGRVFFVAR